MSLKDKVIFISGGSRGIGLAMVKKAAEDGAKIAIAAKTAEPMIIAENFEKSFITVFNCFTLQNC